MLMNLKNDFEFEQRKFTKEDIKEIIFREILEYLPQLLKDYMHGSENTYYVLCFYLDISCNFFASYFAYVAIVITYVVESIFATTDNLHRQSAKRKMVERAGESRENIFFSQGVELHYQQQRLHLVFSKDGKPAN
ncbi:hypothetical protein VPH35_117880 [Triticum aestivum]|uniref:Uncharacterized protein n=1 Tax=Aegilops tauschii subsp. strangulata TaxID=200361 RepID=A0A453PEE5_AEGTS